MTRIIALALFASPAYAQTVPRCMEHATVSDFLSDQHGESRQAIMMDGAGGVVELYASERGTWTILHTRPGDLTCFIAAGRAFEMTQEPFPANGEEM